MKTDVLNKLVALTVPVLLGATSTDAQTRDCATHAASLTQATLPSGADEQFKCEMLTWRGSIDRSTVVREIEQHASSSHLHLVISSPFGWRSDPILGILRRHAGIDLPGPRGSPIHATGAGVVRIADRVNGYGNLIEIEHAGGIRTRYGHLARLAVAAGERVAQGQIIGAMGSTGRSTGNHLHYEVRMNGVAVNPLGFMGQTRSSFSYETAWGPEPEVAQRWTGWEQQASGGRLPESVIR